jgi:hypothetical protein
MIVQAACRVWIPDLDNYTIIPLHRHGDVGKIFSAFGYGPGECKILEQGFLDNKSNFYTREEAAEYMRKRGQKTRLGDFPGKELYSEDLY